METFLCGWSVATTLIIIIIIINYIYIAQIRKIQQMCYQQLNGLFCSSPHFQSDAASNQSYPALLSGRLVAKVCYKIL